VVIRRLLPLVAAAFLVAACGSDAPPQVTFAAGGTDVVAKPTQYCDLEMTSCSNDANAPVSLTVPPGTPLQVTVPQEIEDTPWQVVFTYRDEAGTLTDGRSPVFAAKARGDYSLELPAPTNRLITAQVQQYGPAPQINEETSEIEFPIRASWVLTTNG
jgi:hypothetical protein